MPFIDRADAGRRLAQRLQYLRADPVVVLGLPRGGVPVAYEVALALAAPLDVIVVRKLGVPYEPELGVGAIGEDGVRVINEQVMRLAGTSASELAEVEVRERAELERRARLYRSGRSRTALKGRTVVVVDDGIATGSTARAACQVARAHGATRVVLAVPVAPPDCQSRLGADADEIVCLETPDPFFSIGQFYEDFAQTSDEQVVAYLTSAARRDLSHAPTNKVSEDPWPRDEEVEVLAGAVRLTGQLTVAKNATALVVFAHGSGSSRHSPRNRYVATLLNQAGLATLLFDLLTVEEESDRANVFDIAMLARRLVGVTHWSHDEPGLSQLPIGYFGASTGAGAALWAAAELTSMVAAVVSRGGRPDLAGQRLSEVTAPTLLIVGGRDDVVLDLNRQAQAQLRCESRLVVVPGATHLFEEPGTLQIAAETAREWFVHHLVTSRPAVGEA
jgi:putative phosphoribosyl transferase